MTMFLLVALVALSRFATFAIAVLKNIVALRQAIQLFYKHYPTHHLLDEETVNGYCSVSSCRHDGLCAFK